MISRSPVGGGEQEKKRGGVTNVLYSNVCVFIDRDLLTGGEKG